VTPIPERLRAGAGAYRDAVQRASAAHASTQEEVDRELEAAKTAKGRSRMFIWMAVIFYGPGILFSLLGLAIYVLANLLPVFNSVLEPFLTREAILIVDVALVFGLALGLLISLVAVLLVWRWAKHRRRIRRAARAGTKPGAIHSAYQASQAARARGRSIASCAVCGGPVEFRIGEQRVTCTYCGSVVMPGPTQKRGLVALAFREARLAAKLAICRAEREHLIAQKSASRSVGLYMLVAIGGTFAIPAAVALLVLVLVFRKLTSGVEDAIDDFAISVGGEMERGLGLPFDWLNAYWAAEAPENAQYLGGALTLRWSAHTVYAGRPVLITVTSNWQDAIAHRVAILLAHPATRSSETVAQALASPAAWQAWQAGYRVTVTEAGTALESENVRAARLAVPEIHRLVACAYGISGPTG
jgi:hypothetical protein